MNKTYRHSFFFSLLCMMAVIVLASCEKAVFDDETSSDNNQKGNLILKVQATDNLQMGTTRSDASYWGRISFVAYQGGKKVKSVTQTRGDDGYGEVTMQLTPGTYQVLVLAHSSNGNPTLSNAEKIPFTNAIGYTDTFYAYQDITVTAETQEHAITLERVTAMLRFIINDAMPQNVKTLKFYYTGGSGALNANTGLGCVASQQTVNVEADPAADRPYTFELYTIPREATASLSLTVTAYDGNGGVVTERTIKDIAIERNKITELSGDFFTDVNGGDGNHETGGEGDGTPASTSFVIYASTEWAGIINTTY